VGGPGGGGGGPRIRMLQCNKNLNLLTVGKWLVHVCWYEVKKKSVEGESPRASYKPYTPQTLLGTLTCQSGWSLDLSLHSSFEVLENVIPHLQEARRLVEQYDPNEGMRDFGMQVQKIFRNSNIKRISLSFDHSYLHLSEAFARVEQGLSSTLL
jgi:hypothetical protein